MNVYNMIAETVHLHSPFSEESGFREDKTTLNKIEESFKLANEIVENLSEAALGELWQGSEGDVDAMFNIFVQESYRVLYGDQGQVQESTFQYMDNLSSSVEETLRVENINYFASTVLPFFEMNWHHYEWGEFVMEYNKLAINAARDHGKSFYFSHVVPIWKMYRYSVTKDLVQTGRSRQKLNEYELCGKGYIISHEQELAIEFVEIIKGTIEENDILHERLMPENTRTDWGSKNIKCKNGARLGAKSYGSSFRGRHPHYVIGDDLLKDNVLYSELQRKKAIDWFYSVVMNAVVPNGQTIVVGTPFHKNDLYGELRNSMTRSFRSAKKMRDLDPIKRGWVFFEYPSLYPDGKVLWETRYTYKDLMAKKEEQGSLIFSREHLCKPIASELSIFPYKILQNAIIGMESYTLVENRQQFPIKFDRVVVGCDFAISATAGADFSCFTVFGIDDHDKMWLLYMWRERGKSFLEQMVVLKNINRNFAPDVMYAESNVFQRIFTDQMAMDGLPVHPHTTTAQNKFNLEKGLPSVAIMFEQQRIKFPRGNDVSRNVSDLIMSEFNSVTFTDQGKLESVDEHDDTSMSIWLATCAARHVISGFGLEFMT